MLSHRNIKRILDRVPIAICEPNFERHKWIG
jgi:hypothetical protein